MLSLVWCGALYSTLCYDMPNVILHFLTILFCHLILIEQICLDLTFNSNISPLYIICSLLPSLLYPDFVYPSSHSALFHRSPTLFSSFSSDFFLFLFTLHPLSILPFCTASGTRCSWRAVQATGTLVTPSKGMFSLTYFPLLFLSEYVFLYYFLPSIHPMFLPPLYSSITSYHIIYYTTLSINHRYWIIACEPALTHFSSLDNHCHRCWWCA